MEPPLRVSRDLFVFTERVRGLLGKTPVSSHSLRFVICLTRIEDQWRVVTSSGSGIFTEVC